MPRGRCHFALLLALQKRLKADLPDVGALTERHFSDFLAGSMAPDAMRSLGKMGKFRSHFYDEDRRETWGQAVSGLFDAYPDLAVPERLSASDQVLVMGYVSHLTADEAFRDVVTVRVHGTENWRPIIHGLWSLVDELEIAHPDLAGEIDRFDRDGRIAFIDCDIVRAFLRRSRGWALHSDPLENERVFLAMIEKTLPEGDLKDRLFENRHMAMPFLSADRLRNFVDVAVSRAFDDIARYAAGHYG